jgi:hypothetical protein
MVLKMKIDWATEGILGKSISYDRQAQNMHDCLFKKEWMDKFVADWE